ncbi:MAG TPA: TetR/AcrR family transcriptional regulator [Solirubrobacteraceae bacterium]|jgi:AcrR family transcriptional regulator|nr:TetR/AcrR family transcriptional regulator [Solirubrobacteraceae bacterium]
MPGRTLTAGGEGVAHPRIVEIQRSRMLAAAAQAVEELGYARATVAHITRRAKISRRTFYELFRNREECLIAALEDVTARIRGELDAAGLEGLVWRERIRGGLWTILSFFDREPVLARFCVVQALRGSQAVLERREEILGDLARVIDEGRLESARGEECPPLTAEGLVGAASALIYARLLRKDSEPLTDLLGDLMGMIVLPYLGPAAVRKEQARPAPQPVQARARKTSRAGRAEEVDVLAGIPMRLTYRTMRVLEAITDEPGVSNRGVGVRAEIADQGQISKLLSRLERLGLARNTGVGHAKGEPNAWVLTTTGRQVAHTIRMHTNDHEQAA